MKKVLLAALLLSSVALFVFQFLGSVSSAQVAPAHDGTSFTPRQVHFDSLKAMARSQGAVHVMVRLRGNFQPVGRLTSQQRRAQQKEIELTGLELVQRLPEIHSQQFKQFKYVPFVAVEADEAILKRLEEDPAVADIELDELSAPTLAESTSPIGSPAAWNAGSSGEGQAVAILDTGVDKTHPFFINKVVAEGCHSTNSSTAQSLCPGGVTSSTSIGSGVNCLLTIDGCSHGTHVAGAAAGKGAFQNGVARDAKIIAIQVFSRFNSSSSCGDDPVPCTRSFTSDQIRALEQVYELAGSMSVAAVNLSLGSGEFFSHCDTGRSAYKNAIDNLRSRGVATVISSGNDGSKDGISSPACISTAVSVGSTDDGSSGTTVDRVSTFSNSSSILSVLAPGKWITSSVPGAAFSTWSGTSMAAPHVTGAFAVLKQAKPNATVDQMLQALTSTGLQVTDNRNNITKPRIRVDQAVAALLSPPPASSNGIAAMDFDGDGRADVSVHRSGDNNWYFDRSRDGFTSVHFGAAGDKLVPADYDGDGKADVAVWRPSDGNWYIIKSSDGGFTVVTWGVPGDIPVPADFDGDKRADLGIFRPSDGHWYRILSDGFQFSQTHFGVAEDKPQIGDFDGDGKADLAVFRPSPGNWYLVGTQIGFTSVGWGVTGDIPVPADYDGDGRTDIAIYRPSTGEWWVLGSTAGIFSITWGIAGDIPAPADYDGDRKTDFTIFRPSTGEWWSFRSNGTITNQNFGTNGDKPLAFSFAP